MFQKLFLMQASRYFFRILLSHSNKSFCLCDFLSAQAKLWQILHFRAFKRCLVKKSRSIGVILNMKIIKIEKK